MKKSKNKIKTMKKRKRKAHPYKKKRVSRNISKKPVAAQKKYSFAQVLILINIVIIIGLGALLLRSTGSTTPRVSGFITSEFSPADISQHTFTQDTELQLNATDITGLKITGTMTGTRATVKLRTDDNEYLIGEITSASQNITQEYALRTDKSAYAKGEAVEIIISPEAPEKSIYITYNENTRIIDNTTYTPAENGDYIVTALITTEIGVIRLDTNFTVRESVPEGTPQPDNTAIQAITHPSSKANRSVSFSSLCIDTCTIDKATNPVIVITLEPGSELAISEISVAKEKNNLPITQKSAIPDMQLAAGEEKTLNLDDYFDDTNRDTIIYDINNLPEVNARIDGSTLTLSSDKPGEYTAYIYATDGTELVTSNTFKIIVTESQSSPPTTNETTPATNETMPITPAGNETQLNETLNETQGTNQTAEAVTTDPCSNPDLNQRPSSCFEGLESQVFKDILAPLENTKGETLGRFNRFGNLIIRGLIVQNSTGEPGADDFKLGYRQTVNFDEVTMYTVWISKESGNLYLKGTLREEQAVLSPAQSNVYTIQNKLGIVLGYFDILSGDLYLKGNIVQLGKI
jgi:hypothetical protein